MASIAPLPRPPMTMRSASRSGAGAGGWVRTAVGAAAEDDGLHRALAAAPDDYEVGLELVGGAHDLIGRRAAAHYGLYLSVHARELLRHAFHGRPTRLVERAEAAAHAGPRGGALPAR